MVFVGESEGKSVAVAVLNVSGKKAELNNIAVAEDLRGKGLGQQMLKHVLNYARHHGIHRVEVGTGNSSLCQLSFYQRNGFRITGVVPGFFDHYDPVIVENGIPCLDVVRLASQLKED